MRVTNYYFTYIYVDNKEIMKTRIFIINIHNSVCIPQPICSCYIMNKIL